MQVESKSYVNKSKTETLNLIRKQGNLNDFHPYCAHNTVTKWPGKGSVDHIEYLSGLKYRRDFIKWDDTGYTLEIGRNRKIAKVKWLVEGNNQESSLHITIQPKLPYKNRLIRYLAWNLYIKHKLQSYIDAVVRGFVEYTETGSRVDRNKYGKHAWFS